MKILFITTFINTLLVTELITYFMVTMEEPWHESKLPEYLATYFVAGVWQFPIYIKWDLKTHTFLCPCKPTNFLGKVYFYSAPGACFLIKQSWAISYSPPSPSPGKIKNLCLVSFPTTILSVGPQQATSGITALTKAFAKHGPWPRHSFFQASQIHPENLNLHSAPKSRHWGSLLCSTQEVLEALQFVLPEAGIGGGCWP